MCDKDICRCSCSIETHWRTREQRRFSSEGCVQQTLHYAAEFQEAALQATCTSVISDLQTEIQVLCIAASYSVCTKPHARSLQLQPVPLSFKVIRGRQIDPDADPDMDPALIQGRSAEAREPVPCTPSFCTPCLPMCYTKFLCFVGYFSPLRSCGGAWGPLWTYPPRICPCI